MPTSPERRRPDLQQLQAELGKLTDRQELVALAEGLRLLRERAQQPPTASIWEKISVALAEEGDPDAEGEPQVGGPTR